MPTGPGLMGFLHVGCWNHGGYHESSRVLWWVCHGDIDGCGDGLQDSWWFYAGFLQVLKTGFVMVLWGLLVGFRSPPTQPSCERQARADALD